MGGTRIEMEVEICATNITNDKSVTSNLKKKLEKILEENLTNVKLKAKQLVIRIITKSQGIFWHFLLYKCPNHNHNAFFPKRDEE
jgi:hypothetical protein